MDGAGFVERGGDEGCAAKDAYGAEMGVEDGQVGEAVEQGDDGGVGADGGGDGGDGGGEIVGLGAEEDEVVRGVKAVGEDGGRRREVEVAGVRAEDIEAVGGEQRGTRGADEEGDVAAGGEQACAEIAAESACAEDKNSHRVMVTVVVLCGGPMRAWMIAGVWMMAGVAGLKYPVARVSDKSDVYFGTTVADPYRWMEDVDSPEVKTWVDAENSLTQSYLADVPAREKIHARLMELNNYERFSPPEKEGGRYFYRRNSGLQNQAVLYWQQGETGEPKVLLDPNSLRADGDGGAAGDERDGRWQAAGILTGGGRERPGKNSGKTCGYRSGFAG